jgi:DNA-directed RNA polymerase specialized sigma24 family protein
MPTIDTHSVLREKLAAYSFDIIFNKSKALEIVKESLHKLEKCRDRFQTDEQRERYLYLSTRNASIDYLRSLRNKYIFPGYAPCCYPITTNLTGGG